MGKGKVLNPLTLDSWGVSLRFDSFFLQILLSSVIVFAKFAGCKTEGKQPFSLIYIQI